MPYRDRVPYRPPTARVAAVNRRVAWLAARGLTPRNTVTLEVPGRRTGRLRRTALVTAAHGGARYLVSLAGEAEWVRNVRSAGYRATLRRGRGHPVRLEEVPVADRAPVLRAYLSQRALSKSKEYEAREFFGVEPGASTERLAAIASRYPVFRVLEPHGGGSAGRRAARAAGWAAASLVAVWVVFFVASRRHLAPVLDAVRHLNRWLLNPVMLRLAGRRHWYAAAIHHRGRRSGREYVTPVVADPVEGGYLVPLPYGTAVDWLRNVRAAGGATLDVRGFSHEVTDPVVVDAASALPRLPARRQRAYRTWRIQHFVELTVAPRRR